MRVVSLSGISDTSTVLEPGGTAWLSPSQSRVNTMWLGDVISDVFAPGHVPSVDVDVIDAVGLGV